MSCRSFAEIRPASLPVLYLCIPQVLTLGQASRDQLSQRRIQNPDDRAVVTLSSGSPNSTPDSLSSGVWRLSSVPVCKY
jgi:hypothetical protein